MLRTVSWVTSTPSSVWIQEAFALFYINPVGSGGYPQAVVAGRIRIAETELLTQRRYGSDEPDPGTAAARQAAGHPPR